MHATVWNAPVGHAPMQLAHTRSLVGVHAFCSNKSAPHEPEHERHIRSLVAEQPIAWNVPEPHGVTVHAAQTRSDEAVHATAR